MAARKWRWSPPHAGSDHQIRHSLAGVDDRDHTHTATQPQELPGRATLARRWPGLKVNRLTGRRVDDATGARGEDLQSLLTFLSEGSR